MIDIEKLEEREGVYLVKDKEGTVIYIGRSDNVKRRLKAHFMTKEYNQIFPVACAEELSVIYSTIRHESIDVEKKLIKELKPRYNGDWYRKESDIEVFEKLLAYKGRKTLSEIDFGFFPEVGIKQEPVEKTTIRYWDDDSVKTRIEGIKNYKHKVLVLFLWMTGITVTEAISIKKSDIDIEKGELTIKWLRNKEYTHRVIPIHPKIKEILSIYVATMKPTDNVFPISRQRAWQIVQKNMGGNPHQLRHSFAVHWLRNGGNIVSLQKILGHSKVQTTMEYLKIVPTDQGKELLKIPF